MTAHRAPDAIAAFLGSPTTEDWLRPALLNMDVLLLDHANCELKAASTAMSLMFRYPNCEALVFRMSRLAREELRHFEQVRKLISKKGIRQRFVTASGYASGLRDAVAEQEPHTLVDTLIVGAFIEARSCERFSTLAPRLEDEELAEFYRGLQASESRHFEHYLDLARSCHRGDARQLDERIDLFRNLESALISNPSSEIRFHSGPVPGEA